MLRINLCDYFTHLYTKIQTKLLYYFIYFILLHLIAINSTQFVH